MTFVLAHIRLKSGDDAARGFNAAVTAMLPDQQAISGWTLRSRLSREVDGAHEVWHLWEVDSAEHVERGRAAMKADAATLAGITLASAFVDSEVTRVLEPIPS